MQSLHIALAQHACRCSPGLGLHRAAVLGPKRWLYWDGSHYIAHQLTVGTLSKEEQQDQAERAAATATKAYPDGTGRPKVGLGPETWHLVGAAGTDAAEYDGSAAGGFEVDGLPEPAVMASTAAAGAVGGAGAWSG